MPVELVVHIFPKELGAAVNERGNVEIFGIDRESRASVTMEINSQNWKHVMEQFGRMKGVGIAKPKSSLEVVTDDA